MRLAAKKMTNVPAGAAPAEVQSCRWSTNGSHASLMLTGEHGGVPTVPPTAGSTLPASEKRWHASMLPAPPTS